MNEIMDWMVTPQHVIDIMEDSIQAKKLKTEQAFLQGTFTNRISTKAWAERFMQAQPIDCPGWSNLTDIGELLAQPDLQRKGVPSIAPILMPLPSSEEVAEYELQSSTTQQQAKSKANKELSC